MAVQNHIYIYIGKNGAPTILNVDNAADGTALEQLGALKMPEAMAAEIFGDNVQYADNTTCTITDNPDNAEFPYNVVFDSSKIPEKPKRNTGNMASMSMPSGKYIDISLADANNFIAPANGYIHFDAQLTPQSPYAINYNMYIKNGEEQVYSVRHQAYGTTSNEGVIVPVRAGYQVLFFHQLITKLNAFRFIYAEGEL